MRKFIFYGEFDTNKYFITILNNAYGIFNDFKIVVVHGQIYFLTTQSIELVQIFVLPRCVRTNLPCNS